MFCVVLRFYRRYLTANGRATRARLEMIRSGAV
jgi:hypothetical protein